MKGYKADDVCFIENTRQKMECGSQLIDDPASWAETSCTGMFTFALLQV
jgi:rhamnogalacturonyl hydrolase YesR